MKILAFAASTSRGSINRALVEHAAKRLLSEFLPNASIELLDLNDYEMPIYSIDREREFGIPAKAGEFFSKIGAADALLVSFAEHNGFVTAAWKNAFDWMSRIENQGLAGKADGDPRGLTGEARRCRGAGKPGNLGTEIRRRSQGAASESANGPRHGMSRPRRWPGTRTPQPFAMPWLRLLRNRPERLTGCTALTPFGHGILGMLAKIT